MSEKSEQKAAIDWELINQLNEVYPGIMMVLMDYLNEDDIEDKNLFFPRNPPEGYVNPIHNIISEEYEKFLQKKVREYVGKSEG